MLIKLSELRRLSIHASDGAIGSIRDSYFDDHLWVVRYFVVGTTNWLPGRKVLISPASVGSVNQFQGFLEVKLTKGQIKNSPDIDADKPLARQAEITMAAYYGWPRYWPALTDEARAAGMQHDPHLRSASEVVGYHIHALDGDLGHVEDFLVNDQDWSIQHLLVDTRNWWPGKRVVIATRWVEEINWSESLVRIGLSRDCVEHSPQYDSTTNYAEQQDATSHQLPLS